MLKNKRASVPYRHGFRAPKTLASHFFAQLLPMLFNSPRAAALLAALAMSGAAAAADLVIAVDTATFMPMARFEQFALVDGIHRDVGVALAGALGRSPRFLALPRKRVALALEAGNADLTCGYVPDWLNGKFNWSVPFMDQVQVVLTDRAAVRPPVVGALAGQPIGTVFGFHYPELERALGSAFLRNDAPGVELNMAKLAAGRLHHMTAMQSWVDYQQREGGVKFALHAPLVVATYRTRCALSRKSAVAPRELDRALERLAADGTMAAIEARYR